MKRAAGLLIDLILPPRCPVSGEVVEYHGSFAPHIWTGLNFIDAPFCGRCGVPFSFDMGAGAVCAACLSAPPLYERARSALVYDEGSKGAILAFKHGDRLEAVPAFVPPMRRAGAELLGQADYIVPVPLHRWRLLRRRYNQAALLAFALGRAAGIGVLPDALARSRATRSQGHLNSSQRAANVRKAFGVRPSMAARIAGKRLLLIDDVYTTGATVNECAAVLMKAGARAVDVLTLARAVHAGRIF